jgi:hypothetical protein
MSEQQAEDGFNAEQIFMAAENAPDNSTDFDRMLAGAKEFSKHRGEISTAVLVMASPGMPPIVLGMGQELAVSYALVLAAADGLHRSVVAQVLGASDEAEHV